MSELIADRETLERMMWSEAARAPRGAFERQAEAVDDLLHKQHTQTERETLRRVFKAYHNPGDRGATFEEWLSDALRQAGCP